MTFRASTKVKRVILIELLFLQAMKEGIQVDSLGHSLLFPFNSPKRALFDNKELVINQALMLKIKFETDPAYNLKYKNFIEKMFEKGITEKVVASSQV